MLEPKLKPKYVAVVEAYLENGYDRESAVITAGYSRRRARQTASEIFKRPEVKAYLAERMKELQMSADEAMLRLSGHASGDMRQFIGLSMEELKQHPNAWLIKEIKFDVVLPDKKRKKPTSEADATDAKKHSEADVGNGDDAEPEKPFVYVDQIKLYDSQSALVTLLRQHQLASGKPTEIMNVPQLAELIELLVAAGKDPTSVFGRMVDKLKAEAGS